MIKQSENGSVSGLAAPPIPGGCLPAVIWSADAPYHLTLVGDDLVWLTDSREGAGHLWCVAARDVGIAEPRQLATFPVRLDEYTDPDGTVFRHPVPFRPSVIASDSHHLYVDYPGGVAAIARADGELAMWSPLPGDTDLHVSALVFVDGALYAAGYLTESWDEHPGTGWAFLARLSSGHASIVWEQPSRAAPDIALAVVGDRALLTVDGRPYRLCESSCDELTGVEPNDGIFAVASGLLVLTNDGDLAWIDPLTGELGAVVMSRVLGEIRSVVQVGEWICVALWGGCSSRIIAATRNGRDCRDVLFVTGDASSLCADERYLYWTDRMSGCLCRTPLDDTGAPTRVIADAPPTMPARRSAAGLPPPPIADLANRRVVIDALCGIVEQRPAPPPEAHIPIPWLGWLFFTLLRYFALVRYCAMNSTKGDGAAVCRAGSLEGRAHVAGSQWLSAVHFADEIERQRDVSSIDGRLWRWLPATGLITALATWHIRHLGGDVEDDGGYRWLRLPAELEELVLRVDVRELDPDTPEWRRIGAWLGDAEIAAPDDRAWCERVRERHRRVIHELVDFGEVGVIEALPEVLHGAELTDACDRMVAAIGIHAPDATRVIDVLRAHPDAPPSRAARHVAAAVTPTSRTTVFERAASYLLERDLDSARVRAKLRMIAGLDQLVAARFEDAPHMDAILTALTHEPEAGRALARRALVCGHEYTVAQIASLLVVVGRPWCLEVLRAARAETRHGDLIDAAIGYLVGFVHPNKWLSTSIALWRVREDEIAPFRALDTN